MTIEVRKATPRSIMAATQGRFFRVTFEKKDKTMRDLVGRTGVSIGVKGTGKWQPDPRKAIRVWDAQAKGFRTVTYERVTEIKFRKKTYKFGS